MFESHSSLIPLRALLVTTHAAEACVRAGRSPRVCAEIRDVQNVALIPMRIIRIMPDTRQSRCGKFADLRTTFDNTAIFRTAESYFVLENFLPYY